MWTDWQGTSLTDAKTKLAALQRARLTGNTVEVAAAGVRTRKSEDLTPGRIAEMIEELQYYIWKIEFDDWDYATPLNPRAYRNRHTIPDFS